ncbi:MAG: diphthamide synthesis protein [Candidatus Woesearchaeota archaeon]
METYDVNIEEVAKQVIEAEAKLVLLQFPDGLKRRAKEIQDKLSLKTNAEFLIWAGSCFGSCDIPLEVKNIGVDLIVHFGHPAWK